jgi:hypothetical protein
MAACLQFKKMHTKELLPNQNQRGNVAICSQNLEFFSSENKVYVAKGYIFHI